MNAQDAAAWQTILADFGLSLAVDCCVDDDDDSWCECDDDGFITDIELTPDNEPVNGIGGNLLCAAACWICFNFDFVCWMSRSSGRHSELSRGRFVSFDKHIYW